MIRQNIRTDSLSLPAEGYWQRLGIAGLLSVLGSLSLLVSLSYRPFQSADENQHVSYALDVSHGFLPTLSTTVVPQLAGMYRGWTYTANHPPLFYLFEALPLRLGISWGHPEMGFFAGRILNLSIGVMGLLALLWLARSVTPQAPALALVAGLIVALLPLSSAVSGQIFNDAGAVAASTAALGAGCRLITLGPSRGRLLAAAGLALVAAAVRATGLEIVLLVGLSAAAAVFVHWSGPSGKRLLRAAIGTGGVVAGVTVAGIGWFYARNLILYGDLTGASIVAKRFASAKVPISASLTSLTFWTHEYEGLFGRIALLTGWREIVCIAFAVALGGALIGASIRLVRSIRAGTLSRSTAVICVLLGAHVILCLAMLLGYVSVGGAPFSRYLLPAVPVLALGIAYGLGVLPARWRSAVVCTIATALAGLGVAVIAREVAWRNPTFPRSVWAALLAGLRHNHVPAASTILAVIVILLGGGVLAVCLAHARLAVVDGRMSVAAPDGSVPHLAHIPAIETGPAS